MSAPIHTYDVPEKHQECETPGVVVKTIGISELSAEEELDATKRARGDGVRLGFEMAKGCIREVNGQKVSLADGSLDKWWNQMGAKIRLLCVSAYGQLSTVEENDVNAFLKSRKVKV